MDLEVLTLDAFLLPNDWSVIGVGTTTAAGVLGTDDEDEVSRRPFYQKMGVVGQKSHAKLSFRKTWFWDIRDAFEVPLGVEKV